MILDILAKETKNEYCYFFSTISPLSKPSARVLKPFVKMVLQQALQGFSFGGFFIF
jgi:hypothetical protein